MTAIWIGNRPKLTEIFFDDGTVWQVCSAVELASPADDVKMAYLKTLVNGQAIALITKFAESQIMYENALKTLELKFGQPQSVMKAYLDQFSSLQPLTMYNKKVY